MMKNRIMWLLWLIGMAGATVVTGSWLMAAVLLLSALLLILSAAVTSLGGRKTEIKLSVPRAAERNENFRGRMTLKNQSAWPVFGGRGQILWENLFTDEHGEIPITFSLGSREKRTIEFEACSGWCGCIKVTFSGWRCSDFFHVFSVKRKAVAEGATVIMPEKQNRDFSFLTREGFDMESFRYSGNCPGDDPGETYDIREYQPGDSIRTIHWKLSEKFDTVLVREPSDTSSYDILVMFDAGLTSGEVTYEPDVLSGAVSAAAAVSEKLMEHKVPHYLGMWAGNKIYLNQITGQQEYDNTMDTWMNLSLQKERGMGLKSLIAEKSHSNYRRILYFTAGTCPDEVYELAKDVSVTAVCILDEEGEVRTTERGMCVLTEIPLEKLTTDTQNIIV